VRDSVKGFDNVKEHNRQLLPLAHGSMHITLEEKEMIECGERVAEASLGRREEVARLKKLHKPFLDDALKGANDDRGNRDDTIRGRVTTIALLVQTESIGVSPVRRQHTKVPRTVKHGAQNTVNNRWGLLKKKCGNVIRPRSSGAPETLEGTKDFKVSERNI
jgi:hypothetical protein